MAENETVFSIIRNMGEVNDNEEIKRAIFYLSLEALQIFNQQLDNILAERIVINKDELAQLEKIQLSETEKEYFSINTKEKISSGFRIFLVILTSGIGATLGLTAFYLLHIILNVATGFAVSSVSIFAGGIVGLISYLSLKKEISRAIKDIKLLYLKQWVLQSIEQQLISPAISYDKIHSQLDQSTQVSENDDAEVETNTLLQTVKISPFQSFSFRKWFKNNTSAAVANTLTVTVGTFSGEFVFSGLLSGMKELPILFFIVGPWGMAISIGIAASTALLIGGFFLYSQYKNAKRLEIVKYMKLEVNELDKQILIKLTEFKEKMRQERQLEQGSESQISSSSSLQYVARPSATAKSEKNHLHDEHSSQVKSFSV